MNPKKRELMDLARLFLKLGSISFGGPAVHIAMMENEVVRRRNWMTHEEFLDLLGATNLIPGPNSTEMAIHVGHRRAGWPGLIVAGAAFIFPAAFIVTTLAWAYVTYGKLPSVEGLLYGMKPVIIVVVGQALWQLGRAAVKSKLLLFLGIAGVAMILLGINELIILLAGGSVALLFHVWMHRLKKLPANTSLFGILPAMSVAAAATIPFSMSKMFFFFVKVGAVLYGSGYVLFAFLRAELVERWHWLSERELLDAITVGQMTPGPVFTTATFIGYKLAGLTGAVVATAGIFLPAFIFVALSGPLIPRLRRSKMAGAFLDGVNVAALALMVVVTWQLGVAAVTDWLTLTIAVLSAVALFKYRVNSVWLIIAGGIAGLAVSTVR